MDFMSVLTVLDKNLKDTLFLKINPNLYSKIFHVTYKAYHRQVLRDKRKPSILFIYSIYIL